MARTCIWNKMLGLDFQSRWITRDAMGQPGKQHEKQINHPIGSMYAIYMVTFTINIPPMLVYIPYMDPMGHDKSKENVKMNICRIIVEFHISRKLHALRSQNIQKSAQSHVPDQSCRPGQPPDGRNAAGIWIVGTMGCPSFHPRGSSAVQQTGWCPW